MSFVKKQYCDIGRFLWKNRIWCCIALLMIAEIIIFAILHSEPSSHYSDYVNGTEVLYKTRLGFIFIENAKTMLITVAMGVLPFGLGAVFETYLITDFFFSTGKWLLPLVGINRFILGTLPHGLFEIMAIVLSIVASLLLSKTITAFIIDLVRRKAYVKGFGEDLYNILKMIVFVLIPIMFVSAVVETMTISLLL